VPIAPPVDHFHKWLAGEPFESGRNNIPENLENNLDQTLALDGSLDKSHLSFMSNDEDIPKISESRIEEEKKPEGGDLMSDPNGLAAALAA